MTVAENRLSWSHHAGGRHTPTPPAPGGSTLQTISSAVSTGSPAPTSTIPTSATDTGGSSSTSIWVPIATLVAAFVAAVVAIISTVVQRKTGRENVAAANKAADAAGASAKAADDAVKVNARSAAAAETSAAAASKSADAALHSAEALDRNATTAGWRADQDALSKRYQEASLQLGHEKAPVRLAGVYSMARLADDWPEQRQSCVDVLCAYLRMPWDSATELEERQVRLSVIASMQTRLKNDQLSTSWSDCRFDFSESVLPAFDFSRTILNQEPLFRGTTFTGMSTFGRSHFRSGALFHQITVEGQLWIRDMQISNTHIGIADSTISEGGRLYFGVDGSSESQSHHDLLRLWKLEVKSGGAINIDAGGLQRGYGMDLRDVTVLEGAEASIGGMPKTPAFIRAKDFVILGKMWIYEELINRGDLRWEPKSVATTATVFIGRPDIQEH